MKIGLFALTGLGNFVLRGLQELNEEISVLITRKEPDPYPHFNIPNLAEVAKKQNITTVELANKNKNWINEVTLHSFKLDMILIATFHYKIPENFYKDLVFGGYNIHTSIIPKHCGPSPVVWSILNKDKDYGFSVHKLTNKFDRGTVVYQKKLPLETKKLGEAYFLLYKTIELELKNILYNIKEKVEIPITGDYIYDPRPTELDLLKLRDINEG